jgi:hypothetical protein
MGSLVGDEGVEPFRTANRFLAGTLIRRWTSTSPMSNIIYNLQTLSTGKIFTYQLTI